MKEEKSDEQPEARFASANLALTHRKGRWDLSLEELPEELERQTPVLLLRVSCKRLSYMATQKKTGDDETK